MKFTHSKNFWILSILIFIFFSLLFYSTSNNNTTLSYDFLNSININSNELIETKIGTVQIINNKLIPAKIQIKNLIACSYTTNTKQYNIVYLGHPEKSKTYDPFSNNYYSSYIELSKKTNKKLDLKITKNYLIKKDLLILRNETKNEKIYIFDIGKKSIYDYGLCQEQNKNNSIKIILVTYN